MWIISHRANSTMATQAVKHTTDTTRCSRCGVPCASTSPAAHKRRPDAYSTLMAQATPTATANTVAKLMSLVIGSGPLLPPGAGYSR